MNDPFELQRFVAAQAPVFEIVLAELAAGRKRTHWIWFIFPQLRGLGHSSMAHRYGIASLAEARAYLAHPLLGPRLITCTHGVLSHEGRSLNAIFGTPDDLKFRSSMTLFALASNAAENEFRQALNRFCDGNEDAGTRAILGDVRASPD
ncbi:MAG: DUF1810 domain-containing protein [Candidatus Velthaea sp.]